MKLFVCGDIVNHTPGLGFISDELATVIRESDYSVCNFEGAELKNGQRANCPHQEPGTAAYLKNSGFDLMLLANNHITELGKDALKYTIDTITDAGADCLGAGLSWNEAYKPLIKDINGEQIGFINICEAQVGQYLSYEQTYGYAWMGYEGVYDDIKKLSDITDHVVVFVHAGLEHYDIPLPEIRDFYRKICDAGADIVVGGHTHSAQGYEYYGKKLVVYSMGNFYFPYTDGRWLEENKSYSLIIEFDVNTEIKVTPVHHYINEGMVVLQKEDDKQVDLKKLCHLLHEDYDGEVKKMCDSAYKTLCSRLLAQATCGEYEGMPLKQLISKNIDSILLREKKVHKTQQFRDSLILLLFENETYRWTIIRAIKNKLHN